MNVDVNADGDVMNAVEEEQARALARWSGGPHAVILAACAVILVVAAFYRGHSVESMDVRTYVQMMRGIAEHGLPYWNNGAVDRYQALVVQWGIPVDGHIWGIYSPLYPYLAAPIFRLGGLELVSRFTFATLAPLIGITFLLARRVVHSEWYAALAGILVVISTPITAKALELTPFPLIAVLATAATYFAVRVIELAHAHASPSIEDSSKKDDRHSGRYHHRYAFLCGLTWAAAGAAHVLCFPMAMASIVVVTIAPASSFANRRARTVALLTGFAIATLPVALLNHLRFGSYNPFSYGPIPWTGLINNDHLKMNVIDQARYSAPLIAFCALVVAAIAIAIRSRRFVPADDKQQERRLMAVALIVGVGIVIALAVPLLRERFARCAIIACGYIADVTIVDMGPAYPRAADGLGRVFAGWTMKSTLECTPILALAPLALLRRSDARERQAPARGDQDPTRATPARTDGTRWPLIAILVPCAVLFGSLISRANLSDTADAMGWPWVYIRYTFPALPALIVATVVAVERLQIGRREIGIAIVVATTLAFVLILTRNDTPTWRRVIVLVAPLVLAVSSFASVLRSANGKRKTMSKKDTVARTVVALTIGLGIAIGLGHDLRANIDAKKGSDALVNRVSAIVPQRFALVGVLGDFDTPLTTTATRDVEYADVLRLDRFEDLHGLLDHWHAENRPIYFFSRTNRGELPWSPWPDVHFERVSHPDDVFEMFLVHRDP